MSSKHIIAYFPNWGTYNVNHQNITVSMIPWNKITILQHAFFYIGSDWKVTSTDSWADFQKPYEHSEIGDSGLKGHLGEYKYYKTIYPTKKLLLSIGGWTKSYNFSEMASNTQKRTTFITSCIDFLNTYPFFDGLDIDWEYPQSQDKSNFSLLLKEIRTAFNQNNMSTKMLTIAAPAGNTNIVNQDISNYINYVNIVNIMSYDYYGAWGTTTNHHSPLYFNPSNSDSDGPNFNIDSSVNQYLNAGVPSSKLSIGTPFYSRGWKNVNFNTGINNGLYSTASGAPIGTWDEPSDPGGQNPWYQLKQLETDSNWEKHYDNISKAPYLINKIQNYFYTYEDEASLLEKCNYIKSKNLAGIIIWELSGDNLSANAPMTSIIWNNINSNTGNPILNQPPVILINKSFNKTSTSLNDEILVTITISNTSNIKISNLFLSDFTPINSSLIKDSLIVNGVSILGSTLPLTRIKLPDLNINSSVSLSYKISFYDLPINNPVDAVFYLTYDYIDSNNVTQNTKKIGTFDKLSIVKDPISSVNLFTNKSISISGDKIRYTLILRNAGTSSAKNIKLKDVIPKGLTYVPNSLTINDLPLQGDLNVGVPISDISPNTEVRINFELKVN